MAIIAIVNKSDLNGCFAAEQYTNQCNRCYKVLTCKIKSEYHKNGIIAKTAERKHKLKIEIKQRENLIINDQNKALEIFKK